MIVIAWYRPDFWPLYRGKPERFPRFATSPRSGTSPISRHQIRHPPYPSSWSHFHAYTRDQSNDLTRGGQRKVG
jgi:hypothetical protein